MRTANIKYYMIVFYLILLVYAIYVGVARKTKQYAMIGTEYIHPNTEENDELSEPQEFRVLYEWIITSPAHLVRERLRQKRENKL